MADKPVTPALQALLDRRQQAQTAYEQAVAAEKVTYSVLQGARWAADDAERWLSLPKAARKRARGAPELVPSFAAAYDYGDAETEWVERGWRKVTKWRCRFSTEISHRDSPTGTAARILHRRGAAWCDALEVTNDRN